MAANNECMNCGYSMATSEKECKYCGGANPNFVSVPAVKKPVQSSNQLPAQTNNQVSTSKKETNLIIFIVLLVIFWPAAIVYAIINKDMFK